MRRDTVNLAIGEKRQTYVLVNSEGSAPLTVQALVEKLIHEEVQASYAQSCVSQFLARDTGLVSLTALPGPRLKR